MKHVVVGTAGHIDHGKTSLVKALTGTDTDRLPEEKARGITIDLGFAFLEEPDGLTIEIVDVPGHERFVKNMLAGAGGIDLVMLVIAADEGVMPQTREHLAICSLLRIKSGLVALTKGLAQELAPQVRVNAVAPGVIIWPEGDAWSDQEQRRKIVAHTLLKREGEPDDIARTVQFLLNDAPYITGQVIAVDGGRSINL